MLDPLPREVVRDALYFLSRDDFDALQLVSRNCRSSVCKLNDGQQPLRWIKKVVVGKPKEGSGKA